MKMLNKDVSLDVKPYDSLTDTIEIEGTRYSGIFFRELGCSFPAMVGQILRIDKKEDGVITVTRLYDTMCTTSGEVANGEDKGP